jgi:hypothetical protein
MALFLLLLLTLPLLKFTLLGRIHAPHLAGALRATKIVPDNFVHALFELLAFGEADQ